MAINTAYTQYVAKTSNYTLTVADDVATFTITAARTATLPLAAACSIVSGQNRKLIVNAGASDHDLTIAVQSGNALVGESTLSPGETAFINGDGVSVWNSTGSSGVGGVSGTSGASGFSGFTGRSGASGYTGLSGYSAYTGVSGYSGKSGYSGFSGISGYSGFSGKSGYSGFSGISGHSG